MQLEDSPRTLGRLRLVGCLVGVICLAFTKPLIAWVQLGMESTLHSCTLVVPAICLALGWRLRRNIPQRCNSAPAVGVLLITSGLVALSAAHWSSTQGEPPNPLDALSLRILALVLFANGLMFQTLGMEVMRVLAFPAVFSLFMVPLPTFAVNALEVFFQHTSAEVAAWFFNLSGAVVYREGLRFKLPGVPWMEVAQECSGIRSSYALFLTSLIAGHVLLGSKFNRTLLAILVIPLGIVRNAFRVFTLGMLASNYDPGILDSSLHHQGGPIFFGLSLLPFFAVVYWMSRRESRLQPDAKPKSRRNPW